MTWHIVPIKLTFYRYRLTWRPFILLGSVLVIAFTFVQVISEKSVRSTSSNYISIFSRNKRYLADNDYSKYLNMTWSTKNKSMPLLTLFTTWDSTMQKPVVYSNAVKNWHSLSTKVKTVVFTDDQGIAKSARSEGWSVKRINTTACFGTPVLRSMFIQAMEMPTKSRLYGYSNADILFNDGFVESLTAIVKSDFFNKGPILIVGKRIDVNISAINEPRIDQPSDVDTLSRYGNLSYGFAADYYITNELFPWTLVPDLVIGRPLVDNWIIWFAREIGAKVIDISGTVLAVHQIATGRKRIQIMCNKAEMWRAHLLPNLPIFRGMIECASFETKYTSNKDIIVLPKLYLQHSCRAQNVKFRWK